MDLLNLGPPVNEKDVVVGIASSGRTPYAVGGLKHAQFVGAATVGLACVKPSALGLFCDVAIECVTGPEAVTGSTRLKAGTATKMVCFRCCKTLRQKVLLTRLQILNMISTGSQIRTGKTYGNMVIFPFHARFMRIDTDSNADGRPENVKREAPR